VLVQANEAVSSEQVVVELEKTRLLNQVDVAGQLLEVARSSYATTQQRAFTDHEQKARLPLYVCRLSNNAQSWMMV